MSGFIVIDKPEGKTSHDVVHSVRRVLGVKKAGHTGTLDPFATGVLPVALGEATKAIPFLDETEKEYAAIMHLGISTDTQDCTGRIIGENSCDLVTEEIVRMTFKRFVGTIRQTPPMFSALKRSGVPLYRLARKGLDVPRESREIKIISLKLQKIDLPRIHFMVRCSRGTYVRTLASDLGDSLGCGAHLVSLRRTASGVFAASEAVPLDELVFLKEAGLLDEKIISTYRSLSHLRNIELTEKGAWMVRNGAMPGREGFQGADLEDFPIGEKFILSRMDRILAVAERVSNPEAEGKRNLRFLRVFN